jgi:hypothetical protein
LFNDYPIHNPDELMNSGVLLIIVILGILFVISSWAGKLSLNGFILVAIGAVVIILLNSTGFIPTGGPNPCPGDEIIVVINNECRGMDTDKNVEILKRFLGDDNE